MIAYKYNPYYCGTQDCQICPMTKKRTGETVYLLPANATFTQPPAEQEGYLVKWNGAAWEYEEIPIIENEQPVVEEIIADNTPTELDRISAQVMYTAMMTDTLLDEV